jgi:hypothetical protein
VVRAEHEKNGDERREPGDPQDDEERSVFRHGFTF